MRGRRLRVPHGRAVRPSADRVREALFARLGALEGARVLDLYAGTGALGIEALSRGAREAVFVERSRKAALVLRENLRELGLEARARLRIGDAVSVLRALGRQGERFDLVLLDPPYAAGEGPRALRALAESGILRAGARVVLEAAAQGSPPEAAGLRLEGERCYGDSRLLFYAREADGASEPPPRDEPGGLRRKMGDTQTRPSRALFAASFDPLTNGHLDLIERARRIFDEVVVAVAKNVEKQPTFTVEERLEMLEAVIGSQPGIRIASFDGLLVDYARELGARVVLRGLRAVSDFEYEFEMALMNKYLSPDIEILFMMTSQKFFYVSSSRLKELVRFGANVEDFVPPIVAKKLAEKLGRG